MSYLVITTPSCSRSKVVRQIAEEKGLNDITFVPFNSELGLSVIDKLSSLGRSIESGIILEAETGREVNIEEIIKK